MSSCNLYELDNQDEPNVKISGTITYNGKSVPTKNGLELIALYQDSYQLHNSFKMKAVQDGSFTGLAFNGDYRMELVNGQGAFETSSESKKVTVKGDTEVTMEVTPYFFINSVTYQKTGTKIVVNANISQVSKTKQMEYVSLLISRVNICDRVNKDKEVKIPASSITDLSKISFTVDLNDWTSISCFVRIGVKSKSITEYNYSSVEKL